MDLRQLEYFTTCAKYPTLTKAADALYTTQPHVSMVIRDLEKELGVRLLKRTSKGVELTEEGARVYDYAERALKDADLIYQVGRDQGKRWLRIASNPSSHMAAVCTSYYDQLAGGDTLLQFTECGVEEMIERMEQNRYDMGFVFAPMDRIFALRIMAERRHLEYVELFRTGLVVSVGRSHPLYQQERLTQKELQAYAYIQHDEDYFTLEELLGNSWKESSEGGCLSRVVSTNSDHLMIDMLKSGKVCNIGSYWLRKKFKEHDFRILPIEGYEESISFGYLKHRHHPLREPAQGFMDYLESILVEEGISVAPH